ncbi:hypothetical protein FGO68_gene15602 [Halteria grandinella]|uniref:Uncharacterized protein n=1 Tax=Halteria grandinella TaxID=5974 RepID=A0A8J8SUJ2_HALGN|nr:hypothetical protein FGO68_gene15602 [Halteria grandinella]
MAHMPNQGIRQKVAERDHREALRHGVTTGTLVLVHSQMLPGSHQISPHAWSDSVLWIHHPCSLKSFYYAQAHLLMRSWHHLSHFSSEMKLVVVAVNHFLSRK